MDQDLKITLQEAVNMALWTHNTNVNIHGYTPLQLVNGINVFLPRSATGSIAMDYLYDDECVKRIMEQYLKMMKNFREVEFTRKLKTKGLTEEQVDRRIASGEIESHTPTGSSALGSSI